MEDVPDLPNFSRFHDVLPRRSEERDLRGPHARAFFASYRRGELRARASSTRQELDARLNNGPELVAADFVIPYPPGFPIMVPGQVITQRHDRRSCASST